MYLILKLSTEGNTRRGI